MRSLTLLILTIALAAASGTLSAAAQDIPTAAHPRQVFVERDIDGTPLDRLIFVDLITGEEISLTANGDRYTALDGQILYWDMDARRVRLVSPDGTTHDHPFIQPGENGRRVDWLIAPDGMMIAWTITEGPPEALVTATYVSGQNGNDTRLVLRDGPREAIRAFPVAFNSEKSMLYMDYQPDTIGDVIPYRQYAALFSVDLASGVTQSLPGEAGCFCGAGFGAGKFLRMTLAPDNTGFDLHVISLDDAPESSSIVTTLPAVGLSDYTQSSEIILAPDGTRALYVLSQVRGFGSPQGQFQTAFVLVDLVNMEQQIIGQPEPRLLRPIRWTDDGSAVLFVSPFENGTWKLNIAAEQVEQIARAAFIGTLVPGASS